MKSKIYDTFAESSWKIQLELLQSSDLLQHFPLFSKVFANKNLFALRIVQREFSEKTWYRGSGGKTSHTCKWRIETIKRAQLTDWEMGRDAWSYLCNEAKQLKCKMREDFASPKWRAMQIGEGAGHTGRNKWQGPRQISPRPTVQHAASLVENFRLQLWWQVASNLAYNK